MGSNQEAKCSTKSQELWASFLLGVMRILPLKGLILASFPRSSAPSPKTQ